jgi:hypothetical protein
VNRLNSAANLRTIVSAGFVLIWLLIGAAAELPAESNQLGCYCVGTVGNVNCDYRDEVTIADLTLLIDHLFINFPHLPNRDEANINGDPAGEITIADVGLLIDHLFINFPPLPDCPAPPNAPPETVILGFDSNVPFINSVAPVSPVTGVRMEWLGSDLVDHPYYPPPFEYEYRLYGPYSDSLLDAILDSTLIQVFRHDDGSILRYGQPPDTVGWDTFYAPGGSIDSIKPVVMFAHFVTCDTIWDGGVRQIFCDTILVDTIAFNNVFGVIDTLLDVESELFQSNPDFNRLADQSGDEGDAWTYDTCDSLYDVFHEFPADTTRTMNFVFWVRMRDPLDTLLYDPTPPFVTFEVIDPRHERDVLVINFNPTGHEHKALEDSIGTYWDGAINSWIAEYSPPATSGFDPATDFIRTITNINPDDYALLRLALQYKLVIVHQDSEQSGAWSVQGLHYQRMLMALSSGVNLWVAARVIGSNHTSDASCPAVDDMPLFYEFYLGVDQYHFPGWGCGLRNPSDGYGYGCPRVEDFVAAKSENPTRWPELQVDSAHLHHRYAWRGSIDPLVPPFRPWMDTIAALPQVGYVDLIPEAELMYTYVSKYGEPHPIWPEREYDGKPVMHRLDRGFFRVVHSLFTPMALENNSAQILVDTVMNWLYDGPAAVTGVRGGAR